MKPFQEIERTFLCRGENYRRLIDFQIGESKFVGWHPNCRCYQVTILKSEKDMAADEERIRKGQEPTANSVNSVNDVPDNFKEWVESSNKLFATDLTIIKETYFEKYCFLMDKDILKQATSGIADKYWGDCMGVQIRFKKDKVITTFSMYDSLYMLIK